MATLPSFHRKHHNFTRHREFRPRPKLSETRDRIEKSHVRPPPANIAAEGIQLEKQQARLNKHLENHEQYVSEASQRDEAVKTFLERSLDDNDYGMPSRESFSHMMATQQRVRDTNHRRAVIGEFSVRPYEDENEHFPLDVYLPKIADPDNSRDRQAYARFRAEMRHLGNHNSFKLQKDHVEDMAWFMEGGEAEMQQMYGQVHELSSKGKRVALPRPIEQPSRSGNPAPVSAHRLRMVPTQLGNYREAYRDFASRNKIVTGNPVLPNPFEDVSDTLMHARRAPMYHAANQAGGELPGLEEARASQPHLMRQANRFQYDKMLAEARGDPLGNFGEDFNYIPQRRDMHIRNDGTPFEEVSPFPAMLDRMDVEKQILKGVVAAQPMHAMYTIGKPKAQSGGGRKIVPFTVEENDDGEIDFQPSLGVFNRHNHQPMY